MQKIGFNGRPFCDPGTRGLGRHTSELMQALYALLPDCEFHVYSHAPVHESWRKKLPWAHFHDRPLPRLLWDLWGLPRELQRDGVEVYHSTINLGVPRWGRWKIPSFVTIHDTFTHEVRARSPRGLRDLWDWWNYRRDYRRMLRDATGFFTVSEAARIEICAGMGIPRERITVCGNGAGPVGPVEAQAVPAAHYLYVGGLEGRKNIPLMLRGMLAFREQSGSNVQLLLVGPVGSATTEVLQLLRENPAVFISLGYVDDKQLRQLYGSVRALIFPSLREGFGLPLVEAMAHHCPVIASDIPVFREIAGEAALFYSPNSVEALVERLVELEDGATELRGRMVGAGLRRAQLHTWEAVARRVLADYRAAIASARIG